MNFESLEKLYDSLTEEEKEFLKKQGSVAHECTLVIHRIAVNEVKEWNRLRHSVPQGLIFDKQTQSLINDLRTIRNIIVCNSDDWLEYRW